jgi:adenylyltransferase/sulfurtransferase
LVPGCAEGGVLGVLPGIIGCIQATEILKLVLGKGTSLLGRLLLCDALDMRFKEIKVRRDPQCPLCGESPSITGLIDYEQFCGARDSQASASTEPVVEEVTVHEMRRALAEPALGIRVLDVREAGERDLSHIAGTEWWPLSLLPSRCGELPADQLLYLCCKNGARSLQAARFLKKCGVRCVKSVRGGLNAWSDEVDPSLNCC